MNPTLIIGGALGLLLLVASGFGYWQYNVAQERGEALANERAGRLADQKTAADVNTRNLEVIADLREQAAEDSAELQRVNGRFNDITAANAALRGRVDYWRGRLDAESIKRPKVVARAARIAINRSMRRAECLTDPDCDPDTGKARADPAAPGEGDAPSGAKPDPPDAGDGQGKARAGGGG